MGRHALIVHRDVQVVICRTTPIGAIYARVATISKIIAAKQYALQVLMLIYQRQLARNAILHAVNALGQARASASVLASHHTTARTEYVL